MTKVIFGTPYSFISFLSCLRTWVEKCLGHPRQRHAELAFHTNYLLSTLHTIHPCQPHSLSTKKYTWGWKGKRPTLASLNFPWKAMRELIVPPVFYKGARTSYGKEFKWKSSKHQNLKGEEVAGHPLSYVHRNTACFYTIGFHHYLFVEMYKHSQHTLCLWKGLDQYERQKKEEKRKGKILSSLFTLKIP